MSHRSRITLLAAGALSLSGVWSAAAQDSAPEWSPWRPLPEVVALPAEADDPWVRQPVDAFILQGLRAAKLDPAPDAERRRWIRRVTWDLTGLPPTFEDVRRFLADDRPDPLPYELVVDRLLASPAYGERWGRHWLDVARYGDTDGFAIDSERHTLWRYRDYIIRSLNQDRGFDALIREQVAGDWTYADSGDEDAKRRGLVATSFLRLGPYEADNMTAENRRQDFLNEMTNAIGAAFLGVTIGCARCHDHKYDPISQADFYRLQAFLGPSVRADRPAAWTQAELASAVRTDRQRVRERMEALRSRRDAFANQLKDQVAKALQRPLASLEEELLARALEGKEVAAPMQIAPGCEDATAPAPDDTPPRPPRRFTLPKQDVAKLQAISKEIDEHVESRRFADVVCSVHDKADAKPKDTRVLLGGDPFAPGETVQPGIPTAVARQDARWDRQAKDAGTQSVGRRVVLANWLASPENPLTPRVAANRIWQHHFGVGVVATANDFGANGSGASHPALLDYLARALVRHQWRWKPIHRMLTLSRTYRQDSTHPHHEACQRVDPDNRLLWRARPARLSAESIRDGILAASGRLNRTPGGPGFFERTPEGMATKLPFFTWQPSSPAQQARRSVYMFQRRNFVHPFIESFDGAGMTESCEQRRSSVTAAQALSLFNGNLATDNAMQQAKGLQRRHPEDRLRHLYRDVLQRDPEPEETRLCSRFLDRQRALYREASPESDAGTLSPSIRAWRDLALTLYNSNEFLYID